MNITHLVFDLGGVIVELRGKPVKPEWFPATATPGDIWEKWLVSDAPRLFESGRISVDEFGGRVVEELNLNTSVEEFLAYFTELPIGPYAGARELLADLQQRYTTAMFSNSNVIHWERKMEEMKLIPLFDFQFASHLIGYAKPQREAYACVLDGLGVPADQILFFDDNQLNVDSAIEVGMHAERVVGFDALTIRLHELGIA